MKKWGIQCLNALPVFLIFCACFVGVFFLFQSAYPPAASYASTSPDLPIKIADPAALYYPENGISANYADIDKLDTLPGIGEKTALAWIAEREANGVFVFPEDLLQIKGIGEKKLEAILPLIRLP